MDVIETLRNEMRRRIVEAARIVPKNRYQREGKVAPDEDCYIRETVMEYSREEDFQTSETITALCEYDVFVRKEAFADVTAEASGIASEILAEFYIKDPAKTDVELKGWTGGASANVARYNYGSVTDEDGLFRLPVMIYVEIHLPITAGYEGITHAAF